MKNIFTVILFLLQFAWVFSQNEASIKSPSDVSSVHIEHDLHSIQQIAGTENSVKEFFAQSSISFSADTIYAVMLPPMVCSRCEGVINPFIYELKNRYPETEVLIIAYYPRKKALEKYIMKRQFMADHIIATTDDNILENFVFSTRDMQAPYILKITTDGDLIVGKSTLGMDMDASFIEWIHGYDEPIPKSKESVNPGSGDKTPGVITTGSLKSLVLSPFREITIGENTEYPISKCLYPGLSKDLRYFVFMDELTFSINVYKILENTAFFYDAIEADEKIERMYIDEEIHDSLFTVLKRMNIINAMFFGNFFLGDTLVISASLPRIFFQDENHEELAYYNQVGYLYYYLPESKYLGSVNPELSEYMDFTREHTKTDLLDNGKYYFIPVSKGWPVTGHEDLSQVGDVDNPFLERFYDKCPVFAVYDNIGQFISYLGKLDSIFINKRLGYSYSNPMAAYSDGLYWISDSYSGKLYAYESLSEPEINLSIEIFKNNKMDIVPDTAEPLKYMRSFNDRLSISLVDFAVYEDVVLCVLKEDGRYYCKKYDFQGNIIYEAMLPGIYGNGVIEKYFITKTKGEAIIAGLFSSPEKCEIVLFNAGL